MCSLRDIMDAPQEQPWSHQAEQFDLLPGVGDDADFGNFLDLNLDQEFPIFDDGVGAPNHDPQQTQDIQDVLDPQLLQHEEQQHMRQPKLNIPRSHDQNNPNFALAAAGQNGGALYTMNSNGQFEMIQQHAADKRTMFVPPGMVPPTPNSVQMHSDPARYIHQLDAQTRAVLEQQHQMRKENMVGMATRTLCPRG